jgi:Transposase DDE domain/Transposase domain (DUF772)
MNLSFRTTYSPYWHALQHELLPMKQADWGVLDRLTPVLERIIRVLEWVRVEEFVRCSLHVGRPLKPRCDLARAFCAKAILGLECTTDLIDRLKVDRCLRSICGFSRFKPLPSEATFSRAFAEFAHDSLADKAHAALVKANLSEHVIGAISRDSTAIVAREKPCRHAAKAEKAQLKKTPRKRGRPRKGEPRAPAALSPVQRQRGQTLQEMLADLPQGCDRGSKANAKGHIQSWNGYKLHLDTADCGVVISAVVTSASVGDARVAMPLSRISEQRVTFLYELGDAAYCSKDLREDSRERNHVPLFDHNPRSGEKKHFEPHEAHRYKARTGAERTNSELKDGFGARQVWVKGHSKVHAHLMFGVLCLCAEQLMRLLL